MRNVVDVFVEKDCRACGKVLTLLQSSFKGKVEVNVFERHLHPELFRRHRVSICPATFVNRRLVFYGEFSERDLLAKMG